MGLPNFAQFLAPEFCFSARGSVCIKCTFRTHTHSARNLPGITHWSASNRMNLLNNTNTKDLQELEDWAAVRSEKVKNEKPIRPIK